MDDAFGADDRHALVDVEGRLFRHAPNGFERRRGAALEAVHGLADVGELEIPHTHRLGIGTGDRSPVNHSMMSVSWMASPTMGPILLRMSASRRPECCAGTQCHDLADLAGVDCLLGHAVARIEAQMCPICRTPAAVLAAAKILWQSATVEAIGFSRKTCLPASSAAIAGSVCWSHMVQMETASISLSASMSR